MAREPSMHVTDFHMKTDISCPLKTGSVDFITKEKNKFKAEEVSMVGYWFQGTPVQIPIGEKHSSFIFVM